MNSLRKHWLVLASFGLMAFWLGMWIIFMPHAVNFDVLEITEPIHYWSVITPSLDKSLLLFLFWVSIILAIILVWFIWKRYLGFLLVAVFLSCICSTTLTAITDMNLWMDTNSIEHIQTVDFQGKEYRLALSHLWDEDHEYATYNVFKCNTNTDTCDPIKLPEYGCGYMDDYIRAASLILNNDATKLSLYCGGYNNRNEGYNIPIASLT